MMAATGTELASRITAALALTCRAALWKPDREASHVSCVLTISTATLKTICTGLRCLPFVQKHWTKVETAATATASSKLSSSTAIRMNGRFTDMELVMRGRDTLNLAANAATSR